MIDLRHVQVSKLYFKIMWILAVLLYILIPLKSGLLSMLYLGIMVITAVSFYFAVVLRCKNNSTAFMRRTLALFLLIILEIGVSALLGTGKLTMKEFVSGILGYMEMLAALIIMDQLAYSKENTRFVFRTNIVIALVFVGLSLSSYAYSGRLPLLYLGYSNPNTTAIFLLLNQVILLLFLGDIRRNLFKLPVVMLCVYEGYLLYLTGSRTCFVLSMIIVFYYLTGKKFHLPKLFIIIAALFPLFFLWGYTALYASGKFADQFFLGKEFFSGREWYFLQILSQISGKYLFGDVIRYNFENAHNAPLTLIISTGIIGYVLYLLYYLNCIFHYYPRESNMQQNVALIAIIGVFLHSSSEAVLVTGGAHYSILVATLYWILKQNTRECSVVTR